jgi:hypothetical protein
MWAKAIQSQSHSQSLCAGSRTVCNVHPARNPTWVLMVMCWLLALVTGQRYVVPTCDKVTTSYTCTATKSTSRIHKVRDVTLGWARGQREWKKQVEFESPRRPSCRHRTSAAHYKYTSVGSHIRKPNTTSTSTSATSESYNESCRVIQASLLVTADQNLIQLTKTYYR